MGNQKASVAIAVVAAHSWATSESLYRWVDAKDPPAYNVGRLLRSGFQKLTGGSVEKC